MATINAVVNYDADLRGNVRVLSWSPLTFTGLDDGAPADWIEYADRCVQVTGTFGTGGTVVIEGSNNGTNWATLNSTQGTALSFTGAGVRQVVELPRFVRPRVTAGDGTTSLSVSLCMRRIV